MDNGTPALGDAETFTIHIHALPMLESNLTPAGNGLVLKVESILGPDYNLTFKDSLLGTQWLLQGDTLPSNGALLEWEVSITHAPKCFYRLNVE